LAPRVAPEKSIGARIKAKREELGLNFEQFAALTREYEAEGIAAVTLRRYEREGDRATLPALRELRILCDALDVTADYLLRDRRPAEDERRDSADWEELKAIMARAIKTEQLPGIVGTQPYAAFERQEALRRARLHTKKQEE
jgi:transcriptional regulator with XRE-family HTH domain